MMRNICVVFSICIMSGCNGNFSEKSTTQVNQKVTMDKGRIETTALSDNPELITSIALKFINDYTDNCNKMKDAIEIMEWVNANALASDAFKRELKVILDKANALDPDYGLGFDPIFDAQDFPDDGFQLARFDTTTNNVVVEAKSWDGFEITMKMKNLNNNWLVDGCGVINIPESKQSPR